MADPNSIDAAEKAYAEASEKAVVEAPAVTVAALQPAPAIEPKLAGPKATTARSKPRVKPARAKAQPAKVEPTLVKRAAKPAPRRKAKTVARPAAKPAIKTTPIKPKDIKMTTTTKKTEDLTAKIQTAVKDAQGRAKAAFEKGQAQLGQAGEFSKGNLEALVESGKILGQGLQALTQSYVEEVKSAFTTAQDDVKALTAVKSPSEFVELRREQLRRYFDNAVAYNSKNAEAVLKLANDAFQPLSNRVALAVEKVKQAA